LTTFGSTIIRITLPSFLLGCGIGWLVAGTAQAADWCAKAATPAEVTICQTSDLLEKESLLESRFREMVRDGDMQKRKMLRQEQNRWLEDREACGSEIACLSSSYDRRLVEINQPTPHAREQPSWCGSAATPAEVSVCDDAELSAADIVRATTYLTRLKQAADKHQRDDIKTEQRAWLVSRDRCGADIPCLRAVYLLSGSQSNHGKTEPPATAGSTLPVAKMTFNFYAARTSGSVMDALVVGTDTYSNLPRLNTPAADARLIEATLKAKGVHSSTKLNLPGRAELMQEIATFKHSKRKDLFIFYYAGHAANIGGRPSLLFPGFDVKKTEQDSFVALDEVIASVAGMGYKRLLIVFDACRNTNLPTGGNTEQVDGRNIDVSSLQRAQYSIVFSASFGQEAIDTINGVNSPFAMAFSTNLAKSGQLLKAVTDTRRDVALATSNKQQPSVLISFDSDVSLTTAVFKRFSVVFNDNIAISPTAHREDFKPYSDGIAAANEFEVEYDVSRDSNCRPLPYSGAAAVFSPPYYFRCALAYYGQPKSEELQMPNFVSGETGFNQTCQSAEFDADLNMDGQYEKFQLSFNKYGGFIGYSDGSDSSDYYSELGCNAENIYLHDFDGDGVNDLMVLYSGAGDRYHEQSLAIISGAKLIAPSAGPHLAPQSQAGPDAKGSDAWLKGIGGLGPLALFYDKTIKSIDRIAGSKLYYTTFEHTYGTNPETCFEEKSVEIKIDGKAQVSCGAERYVVSRFDSEFFSVRPY
jgi:uncharacterized protein